MTPLHVVRTIAEQASLPAASAAVAWAWPFDQIAIPVAVLFMGFIGSGIWLFLEKPEVARLRAYGLACCYAVIAAAGAVLTVHIAGLDKGIAAPLALLMAVGGRPLYEAARDAGVDRIRKITRGE